MLEGNNFFQIIKFLSIFIFLNLIFFFRKLNDAQKIFVFISSLQAIFVVAFELYMILNFNENNYQHIRHFVNEIGIGDVYTFNGYFWSIQLMGNAILPIGLFLGLSSACKMSILEMARSIILFLSCICSGHLAFIFAIFAFFFFKIGVSRKVVNISLFFLICGFFLALLNTHDFSDRKNESIEIKSEQLYSLGKYLIPTNLTEMLFGKRLGYKIGLQTTNRDYSQNYFVEMQWLYAASQVGLICFVFIIFIHLFLIHINLNKNQKIIYFCYLLYGATNPYCFDSFHVITLYTINSLCPT